MILVKLNVATITYLPYHAKLHRHVAPVYTLAGSLDDKVMVSGGLDS